MTGVFTGGKNPLAHVGSEVKRFQIALNEHKPSVFHVQFAQSAPLLVQAALHFTSEPI
jgi:hypothetical protein